MEVRVQFLLNVVFAMILYRYWCCQNEENLNKLITLIHRMKHNNSIVLFIRTMMRMGEDGHVYASLQFV